MALELVTGYKGVDHVTADQIADFQRGIYGGKVIMDVGNKMSVTIQTANGVTVSDGVALIYGREVTIGYGDSEKLEVTSGTQGKSRNDLIVIQYEKDGTTGIESVAFKVVEGMPAENPKDPAVSDLDIRTGVLSSQIPFARLRVVGTSIVGVDMLLESATPLSAETLADRMGSLISTFADFLYPVGTIYTTTSNTNPSSFLGGKWEAFGQGKTLVGVDATDEDFKTALKSGGEKAHALTVEELAQHSHNSFGDIDSFSWGSGKGNIHANADVTPGASKVGTNQIYMMQNQWNRGKTAGDSKAHNNMPPYVTVYFWHRIG